MSLKCTFCDGTMTYHHAEKSWICDNCGSRISTEESAARSGPAMSAALRVLMDLADDRLDDAKEDIAECESLDPEGISTLISRLCYNVLLYINASANAKGVGANRRPNMAQMKQDYAAIKAFDEAVSPEEAALYEAAGDRADVFAIALLTFETLGAKPHADFLRQFLDPSEVTNPRTIMMLLSSAMKNHDEQMASCIIGFSRALDRRAAFFSVLTMMEDGGLKREYIKNLLSGFALQPEDWKGVNPYLETSNDAADTKLCAYIAAVRAGTVPSYELIKPCFAQCKSEEELAGLADILCEQRADDAELSELVNVAVSEFDGAAAVAFLSRLFEKGVVFPVSDESLRVMLARQDLAPDQKCGLIRLAMRSVPDKRLGDEMIADYLLGSTDPADTRIPVLQCLLSYADSISPSTFESYLIRCSADAERKPEIIQWLLPALGSAASLQGLSKPYMESSGDSNEVKMWILTILNTAGVPIDTASLVEMACSATPATADVTASFIHQSIRNGTELGKDAMNSYLEKAGPDNVSGRLVSALHVPGATVSAAALANYVLYCHDDPLNKLRNTVIFADDSRIRPGVIPCTIRFHEDTIECNLLQAYLLLSPDEKSSADCLRILLDNERLLDERIKVNGAPSKYRKYLNLNRALLPRLAEGVGIAFKLFR